MKLLKKYILNNYTCIISRTHVLRAPPCLSSPHFLGPEQCCGTFCANNQELHNEGKYNEEWGKFFEDHKADFKGMEPSQQKEMIESHLNTLKSDEKFSQILKSGAAVPKGLNYGTYEKLSGIEKSGVIAGSYAAKKLGVVAEWGGNAVKTFGKIPLLKEGVAAGVFGMSYVDGRAQGDGIVKSATNAAIDSVNPIPVGARDAENGVTSFMNKTFPDQDLNDALRE